MEVGAAVDQPSIGALDTASRLRTAAARAERAEWLAPRVGAAAGGWIEPSIGAAADRSAVADSNWLFAIGCSDPAPLAGAS